MSYSFYLVRGEGGIDFYHGEENPRKDLPLQCKDPGHNPLIIGHLGVCVHLKLPLNTPQVGLVGNQGGDSTQWCLI